MFKHKAKIFPWILSTILIFSFTIHSWAATYVVNKDINCNANPPYTGHPECSIQETLATVGVNDGDTIYVKASTNANPYYEPITITKAINLIGLNSSGQKAWASGTAGSSTAAPKIKYVSPHSNVVKLQSSNVNMMGFTIEGFASAITNTAIVGTQSNITLTYCTFKFGETISPSDHNKAKAIAVDYGNTAYKLDINYCSFIGQTTNTSNWFYVGNGGSGGSAGNVLLSNNSILNAMSTLQLSRPITDTKYLNNTFNNSWNAAEFSTVTFPGYILIDEPTEGSHIIQGITLTHNTFYNSTGSVPKEFAFLVTNEVEQSDAANNWDANFALHDNIFLQDDYNRDYPIVGFEKPYNAAFTTQISATSNWWNSSSGPRSFDTTTDTSSTPDVSSYVRYRPWARAQASGGSYATIAPGSYLQEITGTQILNNNMSLQVSTNTGGAVTLIPTKYTSCPTGTQSAIAYFDLGIKNGGENIHAITATFYAPSGSTINSSTPVYFFNGSSWVACHSSAVTRTLFSSARNYTTRDVSSTYIDHSFSGFATVFITKTFSRAITPTLNAITRTSINTPTRTFFALLGSGSTLSSSSSSTSSSTTTTSSSSSGSSSSTSSSSSSTTTTTSSGGAKTTTTTSSPNTTTTSVKPQLKVSPTALEFGDNDTAKQLSISNTAAGGTLAWEINDNNTEYTDGSGWIFTVTPKSGSVKTTPENVTVMVSKKGLESGSYSAKLPVTSNGGNLNVNVNMSVAEREMPLFGLRNPLLLFMSSRETEKTISINNLLSSGTLTWEIGTPVYHTGEGWLTVSPSSGYTRRESDTVTITVSRENLGQGLYWATIPVRSNAGTKIITVIMRAPDGPVIRIRPSTLIYLSTTETEKEFTITNAKTGAIDWSIDQSAIVYHGGNGWITSVSPASGSTEPEPSAVTITVSREGLSSGLYRADIPVKSNGGDRKVLVFLLVVPFF